MLILTAYLLAGTVVSSNSLVSPLVVIVSIGVSLFSLVVAVSTSPLSPSLAKTFTGALAAILPTGVPIRSAM